MNEREQENNVVREADVVAGFAAAVSDEERTQMMSRPLAQALVPQSLGQALEWARHLYTARLVPASIKSAADVLMVITYGQQLGLTAVQSLQNLAPINGKLTVYGQMPLALVRRSGLLEKFEEGFDPERDGGTAWCVIKRKGSTEKRYEFSINQAKKIKVQVNGGWVSLLEKGTWQSYPDRMAKFKARNWGLGDEFGDILLGLITIDDAEEMGSFDVIEADTRSVVDRGRGDSVQSVEQLLSNYPEAEAQTIVKGFDTLALTPAERRVWLRKYPDVENSAKLLEALRDGLGLQKSRGSERSAQRAERIAKKGAATPAAPPNPGAPAVPSKYNERLREDADYERANGREELAQRIENCMDSEPIDAEIVDAPPADDIFDDGKSKPKPVETAPAGRAPKGPRPAPRF